MQREEGSITAKGYGQSQGKEMEDYTTGQPLREQQILQNIYQARGARQGSPPGKGIQPKCVIHLHLVL